MANKKITKFVMVGSVAAALFLGTGLGLVYGEGLH